jgi:hypothetical protein
MSIPQVQPVEVKTFRDLCICAAEMRQYQRYYFSSGGIEALQKAKQAERRFDHFYSTMINATDTIATNLFEG